MQQFLRAIGRSVIVAIVVLSWGGYARAHVVVLAPNGGEKFEVGDVVTITWQIAIAHNTQNWDLWYSTTGPNGPWITMAMNLPPGNTSVNSIHTYDWTIPGTPSDQCYVRVRMDNTGTDYEDVSNGSFSIIDSAVDVNADQFNVVSGVHIDGGLSGSFDSDDQYMKFNPVVPLLKEPPISLEFSGTSPSETPVSISFRLETNSNTVNIEQNIEAFNYDSGQFEAISVDAATLVDSAIVVSLTGDIDRFVQDGTSQLKTRVSWNPTGIVLFYPWTIRVDQVNWAVTK